MEHVEKEVNNDSLSQVTCRNCDHIFEGSYCNKCGQKIHEEILTLKSFFFGLFKDFVHHAGIFFFTVKGLLLNPGKVVNEYLSGKRKKYYNALNFFLLIGSLSAFLILQSHSMDTEEVIAKWTDVYASMGIDASKGHESSAVMFEWIGKHYNILLMIFLPFWSLATFWTFRKKGYNLGEHFIIALFTYGFYTFLSLPLLLTGESGDPSSPYMGIGFLIMIIWFAYAFRSIFKLNFFVAILASIWIYLFFTILFGLSIMLLTIAAIILILIFGAIRKLFV